GFLLGEDPEGQRDRGQGEDRDGDRVFAAAASLPAKGCPEVAEAVCLFFGQGHGVTVRTGGPGWPSGPLRSGAGLVAQRTSGFFGGGAPRRGRGGGRGDARGGGEFFSGFRAAFWVGPLLRPCPPP